MSATNNLKGTQSAVVAGERLELHPFRAAYWEAQGALLIADLHLGKVAHFRRNGIPAPMAASGANWDRLISLFLDFQPQRVLFLGDLFHSSHNQEWLEFSQLMARFSEIRFELILGNHDILPEEDYHQANLTLHREPLAVAPFLFSHHPLTMASDGFYNLAGHIHPCVLLKGNGRQRARLPCFYFGRLQGILPAFGVFTGMGRIAPEADSQVFVIADEAVIRL